MEPIESSIKDDSSVTQNPEPSKKKFPVFIIAGIVALIAISAGILYLTQAPTQKAATENDFGFPAIEPLPPEAINRPYFLKDMPAKEPADIQEVQYFHSNGTVYLGANAENILAMPEADLETFEVLITIPELVKNALIYAKDKNHVYSANVIVPDADAATFELLGYGLNAKDKNQAYIGGAIIKDADVASLTSTEDGITKDKNALYCGMGDKRIAVPDTSALTLLARNKLITLVGDAGSVYTDFCRPLEATDSQGAVHHADPTTLVVRRNFAYDAENVFFLGDPNTPFKMNGPALIEGADGSTFKQTERTIGDLITIAGEDATSRYTLRFDVEGAKTQFQQWQFSKEAKSD